jgi:hypothetical protein
LRRPLTRQLSNFEWPPNCRWNQCPLGESMAWILQKNGKEKWIWIKPKSIQSDLHFTDSLNSH